MLLYNSKKEFVGIDEKELHILGYANFAELKNEVDDFSDLFINQPGFIHNFKHVNWIDFVECADSEENAKVIISTNAKKLQCYMTVETIYLSDSPSEKAFCIYLNNVQSLTNNEVEYASVNLLEQSIPEARTSVEKPNNTSNQVSLDTYNSVVPLDLDFNDSSEPIDDLPIDLEISDDILAKKISSSPQTKSTTQTDIYDNEYIFDPLVASAALGLPVDLIEEFIEDFIAQAKEFKEELYVALEDEDKDKLKILSHKLKGVAANLRIEDALESLAVINTSEDTNDIKIELDFFYKIISKLSGEKIEVESKTEILLLQEETPSLDIFEEKELEIEPTQTVPTQELNFIPEIEEIPTKETPSAITIPELADDDFLPPEEENIHLDIEEEETPQINIPPVPIITYSKQNIANEIGLDQESFNELFQDYILEAKELSSSIAQAIEDADSVKWKYLAMKLKGMGDNMRIKDCKKNLEVLINSDDVPLAKSANTQVIQYLTQLSTI